MALRCEGPGFVAELDSLPDSIKSSGGDLAKTGVVFADLAYEREGHAKVWTSGIQVGVCTAPAGIGLSRATDTLELRDDIVVWNLPGSVSEVSWRGSVRGRVLTYAPEAIERLFHLPLNRLEFRQDDRVAPAGEHPTITHVLAALATDLAAGNPAGPMFTEGLMIAALRAIIRTPAEAKRWGLSPDKSKVLRELVEARSADPLSLTDLAAAVDLSVGHMLRAFKVTFGITPHQYIIRQRVAAATHLLRSTSMSLEEVARTTGFVTRGQMSRTMRSLVGRRPSELRATRLTSFNVPSPGSQRAAERGPLMTAEGGWRRD